MPPLPDWCEIPIDINQAALVLGVSKRKLIDALKAAEVKAGLHFELRGTKKVFYRENILALRKVMTQCASKSPNEMGSFKPTDMVQTVKESDALLRLRTLAAQKS
jgi:hypothetical protein